MEILTWLFFGVMTGWIASVMMEAKTREQYFRNILLGLLGSTVGIMLVNLWGHEGGVQPSSASVTIASVTSWVTIYSGKVFGGTVSNYRKE